MSQLLGFVGVRIPTWLDIAILVVALGLVGVGVVRNYKNKKNAK